MAPTVSSYLDSVSNPTAHFATLRGIFPLRDPEGRVRMVVRNRTVDFRMQWRGEQYTLKCFLHSDAAARDRIRLFADWLPSLQCPYLAGYRYLPGEITVFSSAGQPAQYDVILEHVPQGRSLPAALLEWTDNGDRTSLGRLLRETAALSDWFSAHGMVHRNLRPAAVRVDAQCRPALTGLEYAGLQCTDEELHADDGPLCRMALVLALLCCRPSLYRRLGQERCFFPPEAEALARTLLAAEGVAPQLCELAAAVLEGRTEERDPLLWAVANAPLTLPDTLPGGLGATEGDYPVAGGNEGPATLVRDAGERWAYLDGSGSPLAGKYFDQAEEFEGGRAAVCSGGLWGLLDQRGEVVIPAHYDEVSWDAPSGLAAVCLDGQWGLCDRDGRQLTGLVYDWMSLPQEGMLLARKEGLLGYLDRRGREAIRFHYDSATSFKGGSAEVERDGERFRIGYDGKKL